MDLAHGHQAAARHGLRQVHAVTIELDAPVRQARKGLCRADLGDDGPERGGPSCKRQVTSTAAIQAADGLGCPVTWGSRAAYPCILSRDHAFGGDEGQKPTHNVGMREASGHSLPRDNHGLWQRQVQLSRGHWRREDAAGAIRSAGWWESVTVTWSPAPAPGRRPAVLQRALATAADMIAPVLADVAVASTRRLLNRRHRVLPGASSLRRQLVSVARELPRSDRTP